jgi:hypothetical protein
VQFAFADASGGVWLIAKAGERLRDARKRHTRRVPHDIHHAVTQAQTRVDHPVEQPGQLLDEPDTRSTRHAAQQQVRFEQSARARLDVERLEGG